jgi:hypothetical protein
MQQQQLCPNVQRISIAAAGLSVLLAEYLKLVSVCPDSLYIGAENRPDLVARMDWVEATRLAEEMPVSGDGTSGLCPHIHDPLSFKRSTQFVDVCCRSWNMDKETNALNFGTTVIIPKDN